MDLARATSLTLGRLFLDLPAPRRGLAALIVMKAGEVRRQILVEHALLRSSLEAVDELARKVSQGDADAVAKLRRRGLELHAKLCEHLELEDRELLPALRGMGTRGGERAAQLEREHREQRLLLEYLLERLRDVMWPTTVLARELRSFVELLLDDMEYEERTILGLVSFPH